MAVSAQDLHSATSRSEIVRLTLTDEQAQVISQAAELVGWTVPEYVLCTVLDRAERDLHQEAALKHWDQPPATACAEPLTSMLEAYGGR